MINRDASSEKVPSACDKSAESDHPATYFPDKRKMNIYSIVDKQHMLICSVSSLNKDINNNPFKPSVPLKGTLANSVDPHQTPQNAASDQGPHRLHYVQKFLQNGNAKN